MKTLVVVNIQVEGLHRWQGCDLEDVKWLKNTHRHVFHIKAKKEVSHDDRQTEFILLKRELIGYLTAKYSDGKVCDFGEMSCEMVAKELVSEYGLYSCEVYEDGENGAEVLS